MQKVKEGLRRKYRKALNPTPIEGIDVGDNEEVLAPKFEFLIKVILKSHPYYKMFWIQVKLQHKFLPKQGEIDRLINQINKKVLRDTKLSMNLKRFKSSLLDKPTL